ncbi:aldolase superfamily protein [Wolffia australiana]
MSSSLRSPSSASLTSSLQAKRCNLARASLPNHSLKPRKFSPRMRVSASGSVSSVETKIITELDSVSAFSEIVPDTVVFDDFERFPPTAATVSSSLILGITGLPDTKFKSAIETALADSECCKGADPQARLSCFFDKALVNVGADLAKLVPGRVSTEVDARLAYDTEGIVNKVHSLLKLYADVDVSPDRLLFKIPSTWEGIEASRILEAEGIQTHLTFVYSFPQAAAAAQAGASVIQIFVGRLRDWARTHSGDPAIDAAISRGDDPGLSLVTKAYNYIHKHGYKTKLMATAVRNKQDVFSLLGVDYIVAPLKILQSLKESVADPEEKYSFTRRLSPSSAQTFHFAEDELAGWDRASFAAEVGPAADELLSRGVEGYVAQTRRVEEFLGKIWPPPNV